MICGLRVRRCCCGKCDYCYNRDRYERDIERYNRRNALRILKYKEDSECVKKVIRDFNARVINLDELEDFLK